VSQASWGESPTASPPYWVTKFIFCMSLRIEIWFILVAPNSNIKFTGSSVSNLLLYILQVPGTYWSCDIPSLYFGMSSLVSQTCMIRLKWHERIIQNGSDEMQ
jgi:hypothetical protein